MQLYGLCSDGLCAITDMAYLAWTSAFVEHIVFSVTMFSRVNANSDKDIDIVKI